MTNPRLPEEAPLSKGRFYAVMVVLMFVETLSSLEHSMVITALPTVVKDFGSITSAAWLITAFALAGAATAAVGGRLGDMFGRRRLLLVIVVLCAVGSLVSALSPSLELIILGRAIQGVSGAILPLCYGITRELAPKGRAPVWIGLLTGAYSFAAAIGYILGGYLADIGSWRSVFWMTTIYSAVLLLPLLLVVPPTKGSKPGRFDYLGAVLFAPAVAAVLYGITESKSRGWDSPSVLGFVIGGAVVLGLWVLHELREKEPLIDVRLLRRREVALGNLCGAVASIGMMQLPVVSLLLLQQPKMAGIGLAVSGAMAGLLKLPSNVASFFAAPLSGWVASRNGALPSMLQGSLVGVAGWLCLYFLHDTVPQVVIGTVICAFGSSMLLASIPNLVLEGTPADRSSEVTGLTSVIRSMFSGIGVQTIAILLASSQIVQPATGARFPSKAAYELTFIFVAATAAAIAALCLVFQPRRARRAAKAERTADAAPAPGASP